MTLFRLAYTIPLALVLAGCVASEPASRSAADPVAGVAARHAGGQITLAAQYDVVGIRIDVPHSLRVSEANSFHPKADIVWHGDPYGDRYQQVADIFRMAATAATGPMTQGTPVNVDLQVTRFHAVTEKARYTIGGEHSMRFLLTVTDARTGQVIDGPRQIVADAKAAGGNAAVAEDQAGRTQKVVVTERLVAVIRRELSAVVDTPS